MVNPKVSVIIPVYNTEAYIEDTLLSIADQTLKEIEIIVINDGSTDNSLGIIDEIAMKDERIQVYSQKNVGQSVARNVGIGKARGEFIYFMDSDDLLMPDALEACYNKCREQALDFVFFDGDIVYENNQAFLSWDYHRTTDFDESEVYNGILLLNTMLDTSAHRAVPWLLFIRTTFMVDVSLSFYPGIIHEDELFTVRLFLEASRIACIKQNFAKHRIRGNSTMTNKYSYRNVDCYFVVVSQLLLYVDHKGDKEARQIVDKYIAYTLNPVFCTAYNLPFKDRVRMLYVSTKRHYIKYLSLRSIAVLLFKKMK